MKRILSLLVVAALAGAGVWAYLYTQSIGNAPKYKLARVEQGPLTAAVSATGNLNAVITVQVGSQVSGQIKALFVDFNSIVKKGQVVARIDPDIFEAKVNQAKADLDSAKAAVLNQQAQVERSRADVDNARAAHAEAKAQTAKAQVAVVDTKRDLDRKTVLFTVALALTEMQVEMGVDEADIGRVKLDDQATFTVDAFTGETFVGRVTQIRKAAQVVQNVVTYTVVVAVDNPSGRLLPGMTANVKLVVAEKSSVLKLPNAALRFRPAGGDAVVPSGPPGGATASGQPSLEQTRDWLVRDLKLSADQQKKLEPILQDSRKQFMALQSSGLAEPDRRARAQKLRDAARVRIREILTPEQQTRYDELSGVSGDDRRGGVAGRAWLLGPDGKPAPVQLTLGLSDGTFTEILRGDLKEGPEIIVGLAGGGGRGAPQPQSGPRLRL